MEHFFDGGHQVRFPRVVHGSRPLIRLAASGTAVALALCVSCAPRPAGRAAEAPGPPATSAIATQTAEGTQTAAATSTAASDSTPHAKPLSAPKSTLAVRIDPRLWLGKPLRRAPWKTSKVAITMDDGPSANTAKVLAIFGRYHIRATFFYVGGRCPGYRTLVKQASDAGFELGDHTLDHHEVARESARFDLHEIDLGAAELERETGIRPIYMRPPAGHWDHTTLRSITERGMIMALWSLHGRDTGKGTHASRIARDVIRDARGGDIILLHETNAETVSALPTIIEGLRRKGLEPVTLSELLTR